MTAIASQNSPKNKPISSLEKKLPIDTLINDNPDFSNSLIRIRCPKYNPKNGKNSNKKTELGFPKLVMGVERESAITILIIQIVSKSKNLPMISPTVLNFAFID